MKPVKWGVLGVSSNYELRVFNPIQALEAEEIVDMVAIASRNKKRARAAASRMNFKKAYGSYEELLDDAEIEAVFIPLPNHLHAEYIKKAADKGKHILCEKPLTMSFNETHKAIEYAKSKGVLIMEAFMYKLHPQWYHSRQIIAAGEIGEVQAVHVFFGYHNRDPENIRNRLETGGGAIPDIGCYAVSCSRFLIGKEPERVISLIKRDKNFKTDTLSSGILDFGGVRAVFTVATQVFPFQHVEAFGSGGNLSIKVPFNMYPDVSGEITVQTGVGMRTIKTVTTDMYGMEFEEFSLAVRGEAPLPIPPSDAVQNQKVLDALFRSEKSGKWEKV